MLPFFYFYKMKKIIIIGATSGIGRNIAERYAQRGDMVGITGRRTELLEEIRQKYPNNVHIKTMDVCLSSATAQLQGLVDEMGGIDMLFINSGIGKSSRDNLDLAMELRTVETNVLGFAALIIWGYNYFKACGGEGHIVVTSSVASVRALRQAPSYSASKRFVRHYVDCLAARARHEKLALRFTTLMPGFIDTDLLSGEQRYPLLVSLNTACDQIFKAIERKKRSVYLPFRWNFVVFAWRLIPRWIWERC